MLAHLGTRIPLESLRPSLIHYLVGLDLQSIRTATHESREPWWKAIALKVLKWGIHSHPLSGLALQHTRTDQLPSRTLRSPCSNFRLRINEIFKQGV